MVAHRTKVPCLITSGLIAYRAWSPSVGARSLPVMCQTPDMHVHIIIAAIDTLGTLVNMPIHRR